MRRTDNLLGQLENQFDLIMGCGVTLSRPHSVNAVHFAHGGWHRSPYHTIRVNPGLNGVYQWLFSKINHYWERKTLDRANQIIAVSDLVKKELKESGIHEDKIKVVVNGVDTSEFSPGSVDRTALGLPEDVPLGLFVGDIQSPIKNLDGVLRCLPDVDDVHLAVAGALDHSSYPHLAESLGVQDRVHFLGFRRDVADLMRAADFFTLPSRRDSCPLVLLEAMASGLPVITSRQVGTWRLVGDNECGFVIDDPDDRETLRRGLRRLRDDSALRSEMGSTARGIAEQHTWERMGQQYLHLLNQTSLRTSPSRVLVGNT
jgi:glycosyltransferase involved in cell wall biosynthesis